MRNRQKTKRRCVVGTFEQLEARSLLTPVLTTVGTSIQTGAAAAAAPSNTGFVSLRLISTQPGRIEADPTGAFGGDVFVVSRGTAAVSGGLISATSTLNTCNATPFTGNDAPGLIYRVDPRAGGGFGLGLGSPATNRCVFGAVPGNGGASGFGGYERWFDLAFDPVGSFNGVTGGPTLFISTANAATTGAIDPRNAIHAFRPDGSLAASPFAYSSADGNQNGILDSEPGAIAVAPGDHFGGDLFAFDVRCDNPPTTTCESGDGNVIWRVSPQLASSTSLPINLDVLATLNSHTESLMPPLTPALPAGRNNDLDVRAMVFDPNRGIVLQGQFGEPAFQLFGGMFIASSDVESNDSRFTRIVQFRSLTEPPVDVVPPVAVTTRVIGDMAFDPVGFFGGGMFFTDYVTRTVNRVTVNPLTGVGTVTAFATNFNVLTPTRFLPTDPPGVSPQESLLDAFSITFSGDGETMFVSDRNGIWSFTANTLANTAAGSFTGLTDLRDLHAPYTGKGFAAAVIDTGVDGSHLGFRGTVLPGFNAAFPGAGNFDSNGHGTSVAGVIHQIAPDAVILPITVSSSVGGAAAAALPTTTVQDLFEAASFVRDNPVVDDPRTSEFDPVRVVAVNMGLGTTRNFENEREAFTVEMSSVIPLKTVFQDYRRLGIVPVAAAGNNGGATNGQRASSFPAVLNEVVEVAGAYPFGPTPPGLAPPVTVDGATRCLLAVAPAGGGGAAGTAATDTIAFQGKIIAFSSRNITTDYAAPGTCVSGFARSVPLGTGGAAAATFALAPINPTFSGTSAASAFVTGGFVLGFDVVSQWAAVAARAGIITPTDPVLAPLYQYLTRGLGTNVPISIGNAVPRLTGYLNPDGINSILQWTAIPHEDVNIGESNTPAGGAAGGGSTGTDDSVRQLRLIKSDRFRSYSHLNIANLLSAVEGIVAINFFRARPGELARLDSSATPGLITASDLDTYVGDLSNPPSSRAMARLLGGSDRIARLNRLTYIDLVQDGTQDGGIRTTGLRTLPKRLLPGARDFIIANRFASFNRRYALDAGALRNYHDLRFRVRSSMLAPGGGRLSRSSPNTIEGGDLSAVILNFLSPPETTVGNRQDSEQPVMVARSTLGNTQLSHTAVTAIKTDLVDSVIQDHLMDGTLCGELSWLSD